MIYSPSNDVGLRYANPTYEADTSSTFHDGGTGELHLGVRKYWNFGNSPTHPYAGGGLAVIGGALEKKNNVEEDDSSVGAWVGGGVMWTIFNIGADVRYSKAEVTLFNKEREAGGLHTNLMLGVSW